jgi:hypothetical protein
VIFKTLTLKLHHHQHHLSSIFPIHLLLFPVFTVSTVFTSLPNPNFTSTMKRKRSSSLKSSQQMVSSDLPDECWELIFRFIVNEDKNRLDSHSLYILNSLSLVSKQFLSITNRLRLSLTVLFDRHPSHVRKIHQPKLPHIQNNH